MLLVMNIRSDSQRFLPSLIWKVNLTGACKNLNSFNAACGVRSGQQSLQACCSLEKDMQVRRWGRRASDGRRKEERASQTFTHTYTHTQSANIILNRIHSDILRDKSIRDGTSLPINAELLVTFPAPRAKITAICPIRGSLC